MNTTHLSEISDKQDGEPVMAIAGEVKYASDINRGTSAKGNEWSRQFFVLSENGTELGCTLWDADDGSVKKGEHVRFENTQNKKGQWSGITKTSYTDKNQKLVHGLEIRANQVKWNGGDAACSKTAKAGLTETATSERISNAAPTFNPESAAKDRSHRIERQHSQEMALRAIAINKYVFNEENVRYWTDYFQIDLDNLPVRDRNDKAEEIPGKEEPDWSE